MEKFSEEFKKYLDEIDDDDFVRVFVLISDERVGKCRVGICGNSTQEEIRQAKKMESEHALEPLVEYLDNQDIIYQEFTHIGRAMVRIRDITKKNLMEIADLDYVGKIKYEPEQGPCE